MKTMNEHNRPDLAEKERALVDMLLSYLPDVAAIKNKTIELAKQLGITSRADTKKLIEGT